MDEIHQKVNKRNIEVLRNIKYNKISFLNIMPKINPSSIIYSKLDKQLVKMNNIFVIYYELSYDFDIIKNCHKDVVLCLSENLMYECFSDKYDNYFYISIVDHSISNKMIEIAFECQELPKLTYFETIPEDLISEILSFSDDVGFINSSKNVQKVYQRHLELIVSGRINPFDYVRNERFAAIDAMKTIESIKRYICTNETSVVDVNFSFENTEGFYLINVADFKTPTYKITSGKMKCGLHFVLVSPRTEMYLCICSRKWKYIWDHLHEDHKKVFYQKSGHDKFMHLLKDPDDT